jgi:hypothetical protein
MHPLGRSPQNNGVVTGHSKSTTILSKSAVITYE